MTASPLETIERLRGESLSAEERDALLKMKDVLQCNDDDAIWQMISVLEYQKKFYLDLPEKITAHADKLLSGITAAAEKEATIAQGKLVAAVVAEAKNLNLKSKISFLLIWGVAALIAFLLICSLMMWAGYMIGTGGIQVPAIMLKMPSGLMLGLLSMGLGGIFGYLAIKAYTAEIKTWWRPLSGAVAATGVGAWLLTMSL